MKRLFTAALALSLLAACGGEEPQESASIEPSAEAETVEQDATTESVMFGEAPERVDEYFEDPAPENNPILELSILSELKGIFGDTADITFDRDNSVYVIASNDVTRMGMADDIAAGDKSEEWGALVDEIVSLSGSISNTMEGEYTVEYKIPSVDGVSHIIAKDGALVYDFANEH